jgi:hypothetical protein
MSKSWSNGSTRTWRRVRAAVLARDRYLCKVQISGVCTTKADTVHHVNGRAAGDNPSNLVASCTPCNARVSDPTAARSTGRSCSGSAIETAPPRWPQSAHASPTSSRATYTSSSDAQSSAASSFASVAEHTGPDPPAFHPSTES